jgi:hypothetical protein
MYQGYKPYSVLFSLKQLFGENADKSDANSLKVNDTLYVEIVYPILKGPKLGYSAPGFLLFTQIRPV